MPSIQKNRLYKRILQKPTSGLQTLGWDCVSRLDVPLRVIHPRRGHEVLYESAREDVYTDSTDSSNCEPNKDNVLDRDDIVQYDTEHSRCTTLLDRERHHNRAKRHAHNSGHIVKNVRYQGKNGQWLSMAIFWDSKKEDALSYNDWCDEIDTYIYQAYNYELIWDSMFNTLEGLPKSVAKMVVSNEMKVFAVSCMPWTRYMAEPWPSGSWTTSCTTLHNTTMSQWRSTMSAWSRSMWNSQELHRHMYKTGKLDNQIKEAFFSGLPTRIQGNGGPPQRWLNSGDNWTARHYARVWGEQGE